VIFESGRNLTFKRSATRRFPFSVVAFSVGTVWAPSSGAASVADGDGKEETKT
jgi:hypothetical protein